MPTRLSAILMALLLMTATAPIFAQSDAPVFTGSAEYDIGFDCPIAQALSPDGAVLWVLMQGCFSRASTLQAFNVADGSPVELDNHFTAELEPLRTGVVSRFNTPMAFMPDGLLSIRYNDSETYDVRSLTIDLNGGTVASPLLPDEALTALLRRYIEYPESALYSLDHMRAAVIGSTVLTVLDLSAQTELFALPVEAESYNATPSFSADGKTLYVAVLDNVDDYSDYHSTLFAYSLPDGALKSSRAVPSFLVTVSPDGQYAVIETGSNDGTTSEIAVVDLANGSVSDPISLYEPPHKLLACVNDGRNQSDVDFTVSGRLFPAGITWLPDSRAVVVARSYGGEASGGGRPCAFNHSRLNRYAVQ